MRFLRHFLLALAASLPALAGPNQGTPDIYANFHIRQSVSGNNYYFRVLLDRPCAPTAVANFLGLVTGARAWINPATGLPTNEPFYVGTEVYKVVPASAIIPGAPLSATGEIRFGSPTNDGLGGPGYIFQDISLASFGNGNDGQWQVYMENDDKPNNNGSRFFISGVSQNINDRYTRLGVVQQFTNTIPLTNSYLNLNAMCNAASDANGKPNYDLTIESITIDGWDENDPTFLIDTWDLPTVGTAELQIAKQDGLWRLFGFAQPGSLLSYQASADLQSWNAFATHVDLPGSPTVGADISADILGGQNGFYRGSSVLHPLWPATELNLESAILVFDYTDDFDDSNPFTNQIVKLQFSFNGSGTGGLWFRWVNSIPNDSGEFSADYLAEDPFQGEMTVTRLTGTNLSDLTFRLHFEHHFPVDAVIDRFQAFTDFDPTGPLPESHEGTWSQIPN